MKAQRKRRRWSDGWRSLVARRAEKGVEAVVERAMGRRLRRGKRKRRRKRERQEKL